MENSELRSWKMEISGGYAESFSPFRFHYSKFSLHHSYVGENGKMKSMITSDPEILGGKPVVKGTRLSVEYIRSLLAAGWSEEQVLENYPQLSQQALQEIQSCSGQSLKTCGISERFKKRMQ